MGLTPLTLNNSLWTDSQLTQWYNRLLPSQRYSRSPVFTNKSTYPSPSLIHVAHKYSTKRERLLVNNVTI